MIKFLITRYRSHSELTQKGPLRAFENTRITPAKLSFSSGQNFWLLKWTGKGWKPINAP